jgi:hypothetical protein
MRTYSIITAIVTGFSTLVLTQPFIRADEQLLLDEMAAPLVAAGRTVPAPGAIPSTQHLVSSVVMTPDTPNFVAFNENVSFTFSYRTTEPGGVRIFIRPLTNDVLTPNYAAHGSPLYATGSGTGTGFFTITSGNATVNYVRIQMYNSDQSVLLFETKRLVKLKFR